MLRLTVVGNDLDTVILPDADTSGYPYELAVHRNKNVNSRVSSAEINANSTVENVLC